MFAKNADVSMKTRNRGRSIVNESGSQLRRRHVHGCLLRRPSVGPSIGTGRSFSATDRRDPERRSCDSRTELVAQHDRSPGQVHTPGGPGADADTPADANGAQPALLDVAPHGHIVDAATVRNILHRHKFVHSTGGHPLAQGLSQRDERPSRGRASRPRILPHR